MPPRSLPVRRAPVRLIVAVGLLVLLLVAVADQDADGALGVGPPEPLPPSTVIVLLDPAPPTVDLEAVLARRAADVAAWVAAAPPEPEPTGGTAEASLVANPDPSPPARAAGSGDVMAAIAKHFGDVYDEAVRVADCESTLNPGSVSDGGGNWGLFQVNTAHRDRVARLGYRWEQLLDADVNAAVARTIYDDAGGWGPWACRWAA